MTQLAALNVKITGDTADLQSDLSKAEAGVKRVGQSATTAQTQTKGFTGGLTKLGNVSGQTRAKIQNTSFQLQDIAVQLQGGTKASTVFAQQLPQLLGGFGALGAVAGVLAGIGIPALAFAFQSITPVAFDFEEALESVKDSSDDLQGSLDILSMSADEARIKFGDAAESILQFAAFQAELRVAQATGRLREQGNAVRDLSMQYIAAAREAPLLAKIVKDFGIESENAGDTARALRKELINLSNATGFEEQQAALLSLNEFLTEAGISAATIPSELATAIDDTITLTTEMASLAEIMDRVSAAAGQIGMNTGEFLTLGEGGAAGLVAPGGGTSGGGSRRTRENPLIAQLDQLQQSLMTQEELQIASFERQQETLQSALEQQLLTREEYNGLMESAELQHSQKMVKASSDQTRGTLQNLGTMFQGSKKIGAGLALANSYLAFTEVLKDPALVGRPFARVAAAGAVLASGLQAVQSIKSASAGGGGGAAIGGASPSGGTTGAAAAPQTSNNVAIQLTGGDMFSRDQVIQLINGINDAVDDGAQIRLV